MHLAVRRFQRTMNSPNIIVATICPVCFARYPSNSVCADYPICSECESEAMEIELIPYEDFISRVSVSDLERIDAWWDAREDLLPNYKRTVLEQLAIIIQDRIERDTR